MRDLGRDGSPGAVLADGRAVLRLRGLPVSASRPEVS
jgi:hypothetical protein